MSISQRLNSFRISGYIQEDNHPVEEDNLEEDNPVEAARSWRESQSVSEL
jgi:hypothetical protein